jgi:hypothetical protein
MTAIFMGAGGAMRRYFSSNLALIVAGASVGVALPSMVLASVMEAPPGIARLDPARESRAGRKGSVELAAKKKKRKKKSPGASDTSDSSDSAGNDDAAPSGGASNDELQRAARGAPKDSSTTSSGGSGDSAGDAADSRPRSRSRSGGVAPEGDITAQAKERTPEGPQPRFLDLALGGESFMRSLTYRQPMTDGLREYQPRLIGGARASIVYYPAVHFTSGFATNLGLDLNIDQAFGLDSRTPDGTSFPTKVHDYNGGIRLRLPLEGIEPSVTLGYGNHAYTISGPNRSTLLLPDTDYQYLRAVAGVRVALPSNISLFAQTGYRHVLSPGAIKDDYFKNLTVAGLEAGAYVGYAVTDLIEARIGVDYRRYFYSMHSRNGDMFVAGGAIDQTYGATLSLAVLLGGPEPSGGGARPTAEASPPPPSGEGDLDAQPAAKRKKSKRPKMETDAPAAE